MPRVPLLLRGLWWRRGLTGAVLAVAVATTTTAALGPLYARAAAESTLQDHLTQAGTVGRLVLQGGPGHRLARRVRRRAAQHSAARRDPRIQPGHRGSVHRCGPGDDAGQQRLGFPQGAVNSHLLWRRGSASIW